MNTIMTHIVGGYPSMEECEQVAETMIASGVEYIEIQIPFSDPIADGPTLMQANQAALDNGTTPDDCFELMKRLRAKTDIPLLFMTYYNIVHHYGLEGFCKKAQEVGCYGLIIPDIPLDEEGNEHYLETCRKYDLHPIQVISPISTEERLKKIGEVASGFVYCVSRKGTTGERKELNSQLEEYITRVKKYIKTPLALGFGISNREHVETALRQVDIAIIGSKIINLYKEANGDKLEAVKSFLDEVI